MTELHKAAQMRASALLRDVFRSQGDASWWELHGKGHSFPTVWACVRRGWLVAIDRHNYEITPEGISQFMHDVT